MWSFVEAHHFIRTPERPETELRVQTGSVPSTQQHNLQSLKILMLKHRPDQFLGDASTTPFGNDKYVCDIREHSAIGDGSSKRDLLSAVECSEAQ